MERSPGSAARRNRDADPRHVRWHQGLPDAAAPRDGLRRRRDGVSRRRGRRPRPQRRHRVARTGQVLVGASGWASTPTSPRPWSAPRRGRRSRSAVCCSPAPADDPDRSSTTRRVYRDARAALVSKDAVLRRVPARREADAARRPVAAVGELGDAQGGAHPPLRHLLLRRRASRRPTRRRRQHRIRPGRLDHAANPRWTTSRAQRSFLLPPTWTQLDALAGRTVAEVLAVERRIVPISPNMSMIDGNWEFEFFDGERYNQALRGPHPVREFVSVHTLDEHPGIATLLLSRPPTNALTRQVCREIIAAAAELGARDDIAAAILFGGHEIFSAGDDVPERQTLNAEEAAGAAEVGRAGRRRRSPRSPSRRSPRSPATRSAAG